MNNLIGAIHQINDEVDNNGWIKCSERLPEIGTEVNVFTDKKRVTSLARFIRYEEDPSYFWDNHYGTGNLHLKEAITHWQPLPKSPIK